MPSVAMIPSLQLIDEVPGFRHLIARCRQATGRQGWRGALDSLGLVAAADEAPLAALEVALADHSYQLGKPVPNEDSGGQ